MNLLLIKSWQPTDKTLLLMVEKSEKANQVLSSYIAVIQTQKELSMFYKLKTYLKSLRQDI
jgi:hypothetical protein